MANSSKKSTFFKLLGLVALGLGCIALMAIGLLVWQDHSSLTQREFVTSPNGQGVVTLFLKTNPGLSGRTNIYVIPGKFKGQEVPVDGNYLEFEDGAYVDFEWVDDRTLRLFSNVGTLKVDNFHSDNVTLLLVQDLHHFELLRESRKKIRQYSL